MKRDIAISVKNVTKDFHLPRHKSDSLKQAITQYFKPKDKTVDVHHALKGISFEVKKGEFFGVLGRNGSGKSTLLKIISKIYRPTSGAVSHNGTLVSFIELGVGFKAELTGRENVYLNGALLGFSKKEIDERYDEIVAFAELKEFMEQKLKNYSSGMKVRLAFAVAIQAKSDILILDEVLAVGDAEFQRKCYEYFKFLKEDKSKTIIFVTHSMSAVRQYCNKAIVIDEGRIQFEGDAQEAADKYLELFTPKEQSSTDSTEEVILSNMSSTVTPKTIVLEFELYSHVDAIVYVATDIYRQNKIIGGISCDKKREKHLSLHVNNRLKVSVSLDNNFGKGEYSVTIGIRDPSTHRLYTRISNAIIFRVKEADSAHLAYIIPSSISVADLSES